MGSSVQETIDRYMTGHSDCEVDDEDDEDNQSKEDFNKFKQWLDNQENEPSTEPATPEVVDQVPTNGAAKRAVSKPICSLCKSDSATCHLSKDRSGNDQWTMVRHYTIYLYIQNIRC